MMYNFLALAITFVVISLFIVLTGVMIVQHRIHYKRARKEFESLIALMTALSAYSVIRLIMWGYGYRWFESVELITVIFGIAAFFAYLLVAHKYLREFNQELVYASVLIGFGVLIMDILSMYGIAREIMTIINSVLIMVFAILFTFIVINFIIYLQRVDVKKIGVRGK